jgi:hypothetical protein
MAMQATFDQLPAVPATAKQRNYIGALIDELGWHSEQLAMYAHEQSVDLVSMSMVQAGALIDGLKQLVKGDDEPGLFDTPPPARRPTLATVQCRVCGKDARIPILADAKICASCSADLPGQRAIIEATLDSATARSFNAELDLHALLADAGEQALARYQNAVALREANDPRIATAWAKALAAGDALAALLAAHDAQVAATAALSQALSHSEVALLEIARAQGKEV